MRDVGCVWDSTVSISVKPASRKFRTKCPEARMKAVTYRKCRPVSSDLSSGCGCRLTAFRPEHAATGRAPGIAILAGKTSELAHKLTQSTDYAGITYLTSVSYRQTQRT